jgi:predicted CoA-binding protein
MDEEKAFNEMVSKKVWAVAGANNNPEKYGNMIYNRLKSKGYTVYAVNPVYDKVGDDTCYKSLLDIPEKVDVLEMVISPKRGINYLKEALKLGIKYVWLQPGTYNDEILDFGKKNNMVMLKACVLVAMP